MVSRRVCTWTPGVEQQVQVSGGVPPGSLHAAGCHDGHIGTELPHNGVGCRRDTQNHRLTLHLQNPP